MELRAEDITIAVTVFNRRDFVLEAVQSALDQTMPVKVIVVEDCGADAALRDFILNRFGDRIEYIRNSKNRGLFDNWNACMEYCQTTWLSILHDDDLLRPNFVETMLALSRNAPGRGLYYGQHARLMEDEKIHPVPALTWENWRDIDLKELAGWSVLGFVGQIFQVAKTRQAGGFRKKSYYTGDWDMWFRLAARFGAAESAADIGIGRAHNQRETTLIYRKGWKWVLDNVQRKRNIACLKREKNIVIPFDRAKFLDESPLSLKPLLQSADGFSRRILFYNWWLFTRSRPPHWRYGILQYLIRITGPNALRFLHYLKLR
jgi:glycosyltransferase involved in cell wall biosynthesis